MTTLSTQAAYTLHLKVLHSRLTLGVTIDHKDSGPTIEAYADTLSGCFAEVQAMALDQGYTKLAVIALEERGKIATPLGMLGWVLEY